MWRIRRERSGRSPPRTLPRSRRGPANRGLSSWPVLYFLTPLVSSGIERDWEFVGAWQRRHIAAQGLWYSARVWEAPSEGCPETFRTTRNQIVREGERHDPEVSMARIWPKAVEARTPPVNNFIGTVKASRSGASFFLRPSCDAAFFVIERHRRTRRRGLRLTTRSGKSEHPPMLRVGEVGSG